MKAPVQQEDAVSTTSLSLQESPELYLEFCSSGDPRYQDIRNRHYVKNKGVHAQQVHFLVWHKGQITGVISGSSAVYATPPRDKFFGLNKDNREKVLRGIVNNIVFRLEKQEKNLATRVLSLWRVVTPFVWEDLYGATVYGFETLVITERDHIMEGGLGSEPEDEKAVLGDFKNSPGTLYKADNWTFAGMTEGNTKNHDASGLNESFKRKEVVPKAVWTIWRKGHKEPVESETTATWQAGKKWSETVERRLKRSMPWITQELWENEVAPALQKKAKDLSNKRKQYLGKKFYLRGKSVQTI